MSKKTKRRNSKKVLLIIIICLIIFLLGLFLFINSNNLKNENKTNEMYISSNTKDALLYDLEYKESINIPRGTKVLSYKFKEQKEDEIYIKIKYKNNFYMINQKNLTNKYKSIVKEKELFVRTNLTVYKDEFSSKILSSIKKGEKLDIIGFDKVDEEGLVNRYKIKYNDIEGYVYGKYLVYTLEEAQSLYSENGIQEYMQKMWDDIGGGTATNLDYYPYEKPKFENNVMPDETRTLYINGTEVLNIDNYIEFAKNNNINAFVIDIKEDTAPSYNSKVMEEYSKTNFDNALNTYEDYKSYIKKAKEAGIYLIGRITTFKDSYFIEDHKDTAIANRNGQPFMHNGSYWPTAYNRLVWEYNIELAKEAVTDIGFNEIQFDYVRFPDRITSLENSGTVNLNNIYNESKAEAIQQFVMYACDEIHNVGGYVSIDVFGESASDYVTSYGQFWAAISNVADVISGMPYPDHFNAHEYGIKEVVWTVPYKLLNEWSKSVVSKQEIIPTPAVVRTWIQTYNATKEPNVIYDSNKISEQIQALYDNGLTGGYMTWNSRSNLEKYKEVSYSFRKVYK